MTTLLEFTRRLKGLTFRPVINDHSDWGRLFVGGGMGSHSAEFGDGDYIGNGRGAGADFDFEEAFDVDEIFGRFTF